MVEADLGDEVIKEGEELQNIGEERGSMLRDLVDPRRPSVEEAK